MAVHIQNICVPVDFSDTSRYALDYAKSLADAFGAKICLMHVLSEIIPAAEMPIDPSFYRDMETSARAQLEKMLSSEERTKYQARIDLITGGSPFVEIVRYAREAGADLIVVGTHGRGAVAHMLLGSVAERVVRKASCPVLTVRHPDHQFAMP